MPVKKLGSKLAEEVRQVQEMQAEESPVSTPDVQTKGRTSARVGKRSSTSSRSAKGSTSTTSPSEHVQDLHPRRVWPD